MSDLVDINLNVAELSALIKALEHIGANRSYQDSFRVYNDTGIANAAERVYKRLKDLASRQSKSKGEKDIQEELRERFIKTNQENKELRGAMHRSLEDIEVVLELVKKDPEEAMKILQKVQFELDN